MSKELFGTLPSGEEVYAYTFINKNGMSIKIMEYGATLIFVKFSNKFGEQEDVVLGFDRLDDYLTHEYYFGATIGRYANRIANARFQVNSLNYKLSNNQPDSPHHLHGGQKGFDKVLWKSQLVGNNSVQFLHFSPDGDQGYPGNLYVRTTYMLTDEDEIKITYEAETDQITPISLTNHTYWNLTYAGYWDISNHYVQILADKYIQVDDNCIPIGSLKNVEDTIFDLKIGTNMEEALSNTPNKEGFNICYVLSEIPKQPLKLVAKVIDPKKGRGLEVYTTQPGVQFYTSNFVERTQIAGQRYTDKHGAFCLETQNFPDAPNRKNFPNPFLNPGEKYHQETVYKLLILSCL